MKKIIIVLYILIVVVLGWATFAEHAHGRDYALQHFYGAWWFCLLWALLVAFGIVWIVKRRMRRWSLVLLHASFVVILAGALLTHLTSRQGLIHLRLGEVTSQYYESPTETGMKVSELPFSLRLDHFKIVYHEGTEAAADYESQFTIVDGSSETQAVVSMNHIFSHRGYRLYQSSYDEDQRGSVLSMNADPWGIPVTYVGYALLFFSLIYLLIDPRGTFRQLLHSPLLQKGAFLLAVFLCVSSHVSASSQPETLPTIPKEEAEAFGNLHMLYNDRICPVETYALDFTKKLYGKRHYKEYSATQVLLGYIFWGDEWSKEPMLKIKTGDLRSQLDLPKYCSVDFFFNETMGGYILGPYVKQYYNGNQDGFHKQAAQIDDKISLVMELRTGKPLKFFPSSSQWLAPTGSLPSGVSQKDSVFIATVFNDLYQDALSGNYAHFGNIVGQISAYQQLHGVASLPSATKDKAEHLYNAVPFATILFMFNLTLGFLALFCCIWLMTRNRPSRSASKWVVSGVVLLALSFLALTLCIALRWIVKGTIPMANGYETMLLTAWFVMAITLLALRRFVALRPLLLTFGFLLSGFFLLVSHISQMDPQITHMMPVLNSPLLTLHVSIIMMSYALISLTFICGLVAVIISVASSRSSTSAERRGEPRERLGAEGVASAGSSAAGDRRLQALAVLSRIFLYPALTTMGLGIFIGAIWANISWGTYWSWDPKETWALITFMTYAVVVHTQSLPVFRRPLVYHAYLVLAFLTILMTYFGVNYVLGGMHSYA
ncbi:MAG: cytochrome c biogenesis protein CcsA [Prevotella sp.]|nr:cytochrome c biogenesis protein CcsA [Prevotella sp.]